MQTRSIQEHPGFGQRMIAVEGVIGVGKTSLVRLLGNRWKASPVFEVFEENPFLTGGFYDNQKLLGFNTEVFFLLSRFRQLRSLGAERGLQISDYLFEKSALFAEMNLDIQDWELFKRVFDQLQPQTRRPDLVVYLKADLETLLRRIYFRDRTFERSISNQYIETLSAKYDRFFETYTDAPVLTLDVSKMDFVSHPEDFNRICGLIEDRLSGQVQLSLISRERVKEAYV